MAPSPALPVAAPLLCAAVLAALRKWLPRWAIDLIAIFAALFNLVLCLWLLRLSVVHNIVYWFGNWFPRGRMVIGIGFLVDPVGASLGTIAALLTLLALIYSWGSSDSGRNHFQPLMLVFLSAMSGFSVTADLFNMFVFFELMSTAAFALCGLKTQEPAPLQGSFNFAITNTVGAFFTLTGISFLYGATGALNMAQMGWLLGSRHDSLVLVAALFLFAGFLIKAAIVPFHFWLPDAHAVAPTPVCVLFSGLMVELGLFAILRVETGIFGSTFAGLADPLRIGFLALGGATAVWGGIMSFAEHHLKRVLAFSTISHSGMMLFAIGIGSPIAIGGWLIYICVHAMIKSGLFFTSGVLLHRLRTMSEPLLFARGKELRFTAVIWFLGGCGLAGLPPFASAIAEHMISHSGRNRLSILATSLFFVSGALTAAAVLRVFMRVFCGWGDQGPTDRAAQIDELPEESEENRSIPARLFTPAALCIAFGIALTFWPSLQVRSVAASFRFISQGDFINAIYGTAGTQSPALVAGTADIGSMIVHGFITVILASILAAWAVFHRHLPRPLRWASHLEGRMRWARQIQSGQPADYVVWTMAGIAMLGTVFLVVR